MKTIVAGTRTFSNYFLLTAVLDKLTPPITEIVCGTEPPLYLLRNIDRVNHGADQLGYRYGIENKIFVNVFIAQWEDIHKPNAVIKTNKFGKKYNALAGFERNERMAEYADRCIVFWDGKSKGSKHMIAMCEKHNVPVQVIQYEKT